MLIDLLSPANYVSFNTKVAELVGLQAAIYISEIMNINDKAIRKKKTYEDFFKLDRKYFTKRTTLTEKEQREIELNLEKVGIVEVNKEDCDKLKLNVNVLTTLLMNNDEELLGNVSEIVKKKKRRTKEEKDDAIKEMLMSCVSATDPELRKAYEDWVDAIYAKRGWMTKKAILVAQKEVDDFSQHNLDVALKVLEIATIRGYVDITWATNAYKQDHHIVSPTIKKRAVLAEEVF